MELENNSAKIMTKNVVKNETDIEYLKIGDPTVSKSSEVNCAVCGKMNARKCSKCKKIAYCGQDCQSKDWPTHKLSCKSNLQKQVNKDNKRGLLAKPAAANDDKRTHIGEQNQSPTFDSLLGSGASQTNSLVPEKSNEIQSDATKGDQVGAEPTRRNEDVTGIGSILSDQSILKDFLDPEIDRAIKDIKKDPLNIQKYRDSEKLKSLIEKITQKLDLGAQNLGQTT